MSSAVVESGGKQYHVKVGDVIKVEKFDCELNSLVEMKSVLSVSGKIGAPYVSGALVKAEVLDQRKHEKVVIFKKKRRHNYRRKRGHRQEICVLKIREIIS
jgi:large subunit ribosomal protein L21